MIYDVIVIGGGPGGIMAAISAAKNNKVLLLEKNTTLGKKLLLTGGGRCNVTNNNEIDFIIKNIIGNGKFLYSAFSHFDNKDIINFFETRNVALKQEDNGRMFPISNSSKSILKALIDELDKLKVTIKYNSNVTSLNTINNNIVSVTLKDNTIIKTKNVILATGGKSFPQTGSDGSGYKLAKALGHNIVKLSPAEVALISKEDFIIKQTLKGISLKDIKLSVINKKGKTITSHQLDMIFTHFGVSGPAVLRCSSFVLENIENKLVLDTLPSFNQNELLTLMKKEPNKKPKTFFKHYLPERLTEFLIKDYPDISIKEINDNTLLKIINHFKNFTFTISESLPIEKSFVTKGGISLKEIDPKTMKSKLIDNLYFAGEIMDINGYTGGYNITAAFVSGYLAGKLL